MRDGLSLLDQLVAFYGEKAAPESVDMLFATVSEDDLHKVMEAVRLGDVPGALRHATRIVDAGCDIPDLLEQLAGYARALLVAAECGAQPDLLERPKESAEKLVERSKAFAPDFLIYIIQTLYDARQKTRLDLDARIVMEMALVKLARARQMASVEQLLARLESLDMRAGARAARSPADAGRPVPVGALAQTPDAEAQPGGSAEQPVWDALMEAVRDNGNTWVWAQMMRGRAVEIGENQVVYALPDQHALKEIDVPKIRGELEQAFSRVLGRQVSLKLVLEEKPPKSAEGSADEVKEVAEMFGGRVIKKRKSANG
jgi:DNA polymerase III gamma/tau subunit